MKFYVFNIKALLILSLILTSPNGWAQNSDREAFDNMLDEGVYTNTEESSQIFSKKVPVNLGENEVAKAYNEYYVYLENEVNAGRLTSKEASRLMSEFAKDMFKKQLNNLSSYDEMPPQLKQAFQQTLEDMESR